VVALLGATRHLYRGNRDQFNRWLRFRVAAQGFTVLAALGGTMYYEAEKKKKRAEEAAGPAPAAAATGGEGGGGQA
jgi:hypothetical protein